jgi:hypothetical protein
METSRRQAVLALLSCIATLGSCARYEWVPDTETDACRNEKAEPVASVLPPHFVPAQTQVGGDSLPGVVTIGGDNRHPYSAVTVYAVPEITTMTDSLGDFKIWAPPGRYRLLVKTIGYKAVTDSVTFPPPADSLLSITLNPQVLVADGPCSGFAAVRVRKPWWKLW